MIDPAQPEAMRAAVVDVATFGAVLALLLAILKVAIASRIDTKSGGLDDS